MSFDPQIKANILHYFGLNPFGTGQCLSTFSSVDNDFDFDKSQSLWNRAMSFDLVQHTEPVEPSLNPFGIGQCLSTSLLSTTISSTESQSLWNRAMSFDQDAVMNRDKWKCLNPFGTGQCLSTCAPTHWKEKLSVSQSLWNRAMSFDDFHQTNVFQYLVSQSLWNRAMSFDRARFENGHTITGLNPFGTGQCLSTECLVYRDCNLQCLNPFGTGQCLSTYS